MQIPVKRPPTEAQLKFRKMIEVYPEISKYWDWDKRDYDRLELMLAMLHRLSGGEVIMAHFFLAVWRQDHQALFDIAGAGRYLDANNRGVIADWLRNPFFP